MASKSFFDRLKDSVTEAGSTLTGPQGVEGLAARARETWAGQSTLTKGAVAGGLLGVLLSGNARRLVGTGVKVGGAALIGGLAYKAYEDWKAGRASDATDEVPQAEGTAFLPADPAAQDDLSLRLLQAMVAAAKADGQISADERARIEAQLEALGMGDAARAMIADDLSAPLDLMQVAALARTPEEAAEVFTASLMAVGTPNPAEAAYLDQLSDALGLAPDLVARLRAQTAG